MPVTIDQDGYTVTTDEAGNVLMKQALAPVEQPVPGPKRRLTKKEFIDLLTLEELGAIYNQDYNVPIKIWLAYFTYLTPDPDGTSVDLDDPKTREGLQAIAFLIPSFTPSRIDQILAGA